MPLSADFARRLLPLLPEVVSGYGTPFHVYDERGIRETHHAMTRAFESAGFRQYFAVKALPNPAVLSLLRSAGSGLDCSSPVELLLATSVGATGADIVFTANNTPPSEYAMARELGALVTLDSPQLLDTLDPLPAVIAFRAAPHGLAAGSVLMGDPVRSKFGVPAGELAGAYRRAKQLGATRFGMHGMTCANELDTKRAIRAAVDLIELAARTAGLAGIAMEYLNIGGGLGIPAHPADAPLDYEAYAGAVTAARDLAFGADGPRILSECGRYVTGPHGVLVSRVMTVSRKGKDVVGLDACMSALMRPAMYGAYHHISLPFATGRRTGRFDVVGPLCENMDKFAVDRLLPEPRVGDIVLVHDTGAHGHAMGFTYNGRLRPAELLLTADDQLVAIRRPETFDDYLATAGWRPLSGLG